MIENRGGENGAAAPADRDGVAERDVVALHDALAAPAALSSPAALASHGRPVSEGLVLLTLYLGALSALPPLSIDMGLPGLPAIEARFLDALGRGPLTLSLFLAGFAVTPVFCGPLADRFGRRPLLLAGLSLFVVAALLAATAGSFATLLVFRLVQGIAAGVCVVLPLAIVRDVFDDSVARTRLSQVGAVLGIAPIVAPVLGAWLVALDGWRSIYGAQAAFGAVLLLAGVFRFKETLPPARRRRLDRVQLVETYRIVLADRGFRDFSLVYALEFGCVFAFVSGSPAVLMQRFGLSARSFAALFALVTCCALAGSLASARLSTRQVSSDAILSRGLVAMCAAASLAMLLALADRASPEVLLPLVAIVVFCFELTVPSANHQALLGMRHVAGAASGVMRSLQMAAGAAASAIVAALERFGHPALTMTLTMMLFGVAAIAIYRRHSVATTSA